jgi:hypothetical protein
VCSCSRKTFSSECNANYAGENVASQGSCSYYVADSQQAESSPASSGAPAAFVAGVVVAGVVVLAIAAVIGFRLKKKASAKAETTGKMEWDTTGTM